jgi:hypothetical protein
MTTITDLLQQSKQYDTFKYDFREVGSGIMFGDVDGVGMLQCNFLDGISNIGTLTPHAMNQWATLLGINPAYLAKCPAWLQSTNITHWKQERTAQSQQPKSRVIDKYLVRTYDGTVRAMLSDGYEPVDNTTILDMLHDAIYGIEYKLVRPVLTPDEMVLKVTVADTQHGNYAIGVALHNGEIGNRALKVLPFIQRHSCTNSIVFEQGGFTHQHRWTSAAYLRASVQENIGSVLSLAAERVEAMVEAEAVEIPSVISVLEKLTREFKIRPVFLPHMIHGTEGKNTHGAVINGLTYAAHATPNATVDEAVQLETLAGAYLMRNFFASVD